MWFKKPYGEADGERYDDDDDDDDKDKTGGSGMGRANWSHQPQDLNICARLLMSIYLVTSRIKMHFSLIFFLPIANYLTF